MASSENKFMNNDPLIINMQCTDKYDFLKNFIYAYDQLFLGRKN